MLRSRWGVSPEGRRAKLYRMTASGTGALQSERMNWRLFAGAVEHILAGT
jgi:DNA-binding PadR family transcriptional regulator